MTYETFDNSLTLIMTAMIYGTGLWLIAAFTLFVINHDIPDHTDHMDQALVQSVQPTQPETSEARSLLPEVVPTQSANPITQPASITAEPVNFKLWKATDLRCPRLRETFGIPLRPAGQNRAYRKAELEALYRKAIESATAL